MWRRKIPAKESIPQIRISAAEGNGLLNEKKESTS